MEKEFSRNKEKLEAAYQLLLEPTTTFEKFEKIRTLLKGIDPTIDKTLTSCSNVIKKLKKLQKGEIIELAVEALPDNTEKEKKRKKYLLLFLSTWKDLRSEVKRVKELSQEGQTDGKATSQGQVMTLGKIFALAKGPLGVITISAVAIVGVIQILESSAVSIMIKNRGCTSLMPISEISLPPIPGIKLPNESIPDGGDAEAKIPPLEVTIDGTKRGFVKLSALGLSMDYNLPGTNVDFLFNKQSLIGKRTTISLSQSKEHELVVRCF
ncbi:hypothetical protein HYW55_05265 [Candidatus Gottesmanbacteria bacterium]|nr:hypothetical protein [Candidatus Gottesmanbacteria bacterium]